MTASSLLAQSEEVLVAVTILRALRRAPRREAESAGGARDRTEWSPRRERVGHDGRFSKRRGQCAFCTAKSARKIVTAESTDERGEYTGF